MIITKILGGLGNQLFQYAAGKALAVQNNTGLKLDLTAFDQYKLRNFELDRFKVSYTVASEEEIENYKATTPFQRIRSRFTPVSQKRFYKQPFFRFDPAFSSLRSPVYLQGYFQSEKYIAPVKESLRSELTFKEPPLPKIIAFAERLRSENSVSVHVRRGDYKNAESLRVHGVLPDAYYQSAVRHVQKHTGGKTTFYVFSDDAEAAKKLRLPDAEIVSGRISQNHYEDFYLMQNCRHNVIANSSFSWWAAWLNNNPGKIVMAPQRWFNEGPKDTQDLLPESWIRL